jgi:hypothetical protein
VKDQETEHSALCSNMGASSLVRGQEEKENKKKGIKLITL